MRLKNTFEEEFAEDTWCKLSKKVALNTSQSVVSLASFKGEITMLYDLYFSIFVCFLYSIT